LDCTTAGSWPDSEASGPGHEPIPTITTPTPEEVIAELCRPAQMLACHYPTNTVEVSGELPIRITV